MADQSSSPALSDDELRETLDMVGTVLASVSDRVDAQSNSMDRLVKTATEARQAAFAARSQTSPENYGDIISEIVRENLDESLIRMTEFGGLLAEQTQKTKMVLEKAEEDKWAILRDVRNREEKADRLKHLLPWFGLGAVVVALAMTIALPRFFASNATTCAVLGAEWTRTTNGVDACVFYDR
jgi:hypothetical protein